MSEPRTPVAGSDADVTLGSRGRELEWQRRFAALTLAWLAAETLTGLGLWLLPFSVPAQWMVVVHTAVGLLFLAPVLVYQWQHLVAYWSAAAGRRRRGWATSRRPRRWSRSSPGSCSPCRRSGARGSPTPGTASTSSRPSRSLAFAAAARPGRRACATGPPRSSSALEALRAAEARTLGARRGGLRC